MRGALLLLTDRSTSRHRKYHSIANDNSRPSTLDPRPLMYFVRRILFAVPLLLVISLLAFMLVKAMPGGPFDRERAHASPEVERNLRAAYHLDEPGWKQYLRYLGLLWERSPDGSLHHVSGGLLNGDFGKSTKYRNHTVNDIIAQGLPVSLLLGAVAFGFAMGLGLPIGF